MWKNLTLEAELLPLQAHSNTSPISRTGLVLPANASSGRGSRVSIRPPPGSRISTPTLPSRLSERRASSAHGLQAPFRGALRLGWKEAAPASASPCQRQPPPAALPGQPRISSQPSRRKRSRPGTAPHLPTSPGDTTKHHRCRKVGDSTWTTPPTLTNALSTALPRPRTAPAAAPAAAPPPATRKPRAAASTTAATSIPGAWRPPDSLTPPPPVQGPPPPVAGRPLRQLRKDRYAPSGGGCDLVGWEGRTVAWFHVPPVSRASPGSRCPVILCGSHEEELSDRTGAARGSRSIPVLPLLPEHPSAPAAPGAAQCSRCSRSIPVLPLLPEHPSAPAAPGASQCSRGSPSIPVLPRLPEHPSAPAAPRASQCSRCSRSIPVLPLLPEQPSAPAAPRASQCSRGSPSIPVLPLLPEHPSAPAAPGASQCSRGSQCIPVFPRLPVLLEHPSVPGASCCCQGSCLGEQPKTESTSPGDLGELWDKVAEPGSPPAPKFRSGFFFCRRRRLSRSAPAPAAAPRPRENPAWITKDLDNGQPAGVYSGRRGVSSPASSEQQVDARSGCTPPPPIPPPFPYTPHPQQAANGQAANGQPLGYRTPSTPQPPPLPHPRYHHRMPAPAAPPPPPAAPAPAPPPAALV
ncbi:basic proline-rich protein-like [Indicator indicator]|uniref:basic proline-rich protein-like n=1 Tax=Indicator indicator TaxID=1002788 RepID=UPI0023DF75B7|nr:basic proline-rich protein-like [Indicator indicator]